MARSRSAFLITGALLAAGGIVVARTARRRRRAPDTGRLTGYVQGRGDYAEAMSARAETESGTW